MPWRNPIVAGEQLQLNSIHSPDFVTTVSGWTINRDGSAEFNDVLIRGSLDVNGNVIFRGDNVLIVEDPDNPPLPLLAIAADEFTYGAAVVHEGINVYNNDAGDIISQFNISRDNFIGDTFLTLEGVADPMEDTAYIRYLPQPGLSGGMVNLLMRSGTYSNSATRPNASINMKSRSGDNSIRSEIELDASVTTVENELVVESTAQFNGATSLGTNEAQGSVSVAGGSGAVTTAPIAYPSLSGTGNIRGWCTAVTGSNAFVFCALTGLTATGGTVNVLRNNATATSIYWYVRRELV